MARKKGIRIVELVREEAHAFGWLDQTRKNMLEGNIEQCERNLAKSAEKDKQALEDFGRRVRGEK